MANDFEEKKQEILSRLDVQAELAAVGIQFSGAPTAKGWVPCYNPYKQEQHPSCGLNISSGSYRGCIVAWNMTHLGVSRVGFSFFDLMADFMPSMHGDFWAVIKHFAAKTGVKLGKKQTPTQDVVDRLVAGITPDARNYLNTKRGLTDDTIALFQLGWHPKRKRGSIPVYDKDDNIVNIRYHNSKGSPKTQNTAGYGDARLFNVNTLVKSQPKSAVIITEGEYDCMLVQQETGIQAVSPTNGCTAFLDSYVDYFKGHDVIILFDSDDAGKNAVQNSLLPMFKKAVEAGDIPSIKVVWLFDKPDKNMKDATDWFMKGNGTGQKLIDIINNTSPYIFTSLTSKLPAPISLSSFISIENYKYIGQRVTVPIYIFGENSETYHAANAIKISKCALRDKSKCTGPADQLWLCSDEIEFGYQDAAYLFCIETSDLRFKNMLSDYICDKGERPSVRFSRSKRLTLRETLAHQIVDKGIAVGGADLIEKEIYVVDHQSVPIGQYMATGFVHTNPHNQKPTMLVDTMQKLDEDWESFNLNSSREDLRKIQAYDPLEIVSNLSKNVTRIYRRDDIHLGTLLTLVSPQWINIPGEGRVRGWLNSVVIGDTASGKTKVAQSILEYADVGCRISGMTSSRTGITYAIDYSERHGWRIKAGAMLKMSGQALIIDEAQDIDEQEIKTMAEAMDTGEIVIARVQSRTFNSRTRCLFICNPIIKNRAANQRPMDTFRYGCQSLIDIFPQMMLRRMDFAMFASMSDMFDNEGNNIILFPAAIDKNRNNGGGRDHSSQMADIENDKKSDSQDDAPAIRYIELQALIHYAWNLSADRIKISKQVYKLIERNAAEMSMTYGMCSDLPLVHPSDFRYSLCRMAVAMAVLDLNSYDDFESITVEEKHVMFVRHEFIEKVYNNKNCLLNEYSQGFAKTAALSVADSEVAFNNFKSMLDGTHSIAKSRMLNMFRDISELGIGSGSKINQLDFANQFSCNVRTIRSHMAWLVKHDMVKSGRGYEPTMKGIAFYNFILSNDKTTSNPANRIFTEENLEN